MRFTLEIKMDNDAFQDDPMGELSQTIKEVAEILPISHENIRSVSGNIKDINGNTVGKWELS